MPAVVELRKPVEPLGMLVRVHPGVDFLRGELGKVVVRRDGGGVAELQPRKLERGVTRFLPLIKTTWRASSSFRISISIRPTIPALSSIVTSVLSRSENRRPFRCRSAFQNVARSRRRRSSRRCSRRVRIRGRCARCRRGTALTKPLRRSCNFQDPKDRALLAISHARPSFLGCWLVTGLVLSFATRYRRALGARRMESFQVTPVVPR